MEWKVCPENTESRILFERITLIKQLVEKRGEVTREEEALDGRIYSRVKSCCGTMGRQRLCFVDVMEFVHLDNDITQTRNTSRWVID